MGRSLRKEPGTYVGEIHVCATVSFSSLSTLGWNSAPQLRHRNHSKPPRVPSGTPGPKHIGQSHSGSKSKSILGTTD